MSGINRDEWLAAVAEVEGVSDPDAITRDELGVLLGLSKSATKERIVKLLADGLVQRSRKRVTNNAGHLQWIPAYRLMKAPKKKA
jgi:predicted transcriptional regulator